MMMKQSARAVLSGAFKWLHAATTVPPTGIAIDDSFLQFFLDYAAAQFRCNYLSSVCPLVWDNVPEPTQPPIAVSRIFCGEITNKVLNKITVFGFGASMFATKSGGDLCLYKGGIKDMPCYIVRGQRMVPVRKGK